MPHSTNRSIDSSSYSFDHLPGLSASSKSTTRGDKPSSSSRPSSQSYARNRRSLPSAELLSQPVGKYGFEQDFVQKHLGNRTSMIADYNNSSKQRSQQYDGQSQYNDGMSSSGREVAQRDSPVIAELRTNVIIKDEFTLVTDLSVHLAIRYSKPDSAIMVKVDHSACLALGGTFDPCYILTITAVPSQMGQNTNKRNAALIQSFMADILSVPPERGILKFSPVEEENFAINGTTMLGEVERPEKQQQQQAPEAGSTMRRVLSNSRKSMSSFKRTPSKVMSENNLQEVQEVKRPNSRPTGYKITEIGGSNVEGNDSPQDRRPRHERKRSMTNPQTTVIATTDVFELPAFDTDKQRPSTSHSQTASNGSNGLRMNGISDTDLVNSRLPNGRPRTFAGAPSGYKRNSTFGMASVPVPAPLRQSAYSTPTTQSSDLSVRRGRAPSFLKTDPTKRHERSSRPGSRGKGSQSVPADENRSRPTDSYMDSLLGAPAQLRQFAAGFGRDKEFRSPDKNSQQKSNGTEEPTANQAKRRSTMTAVPKIPDRLSVPPSEASDTRSQTSLKVGKRKSFLSAFRRSATPAAAA